LSLKSKVIAAAAALTILSGVSTVSAITASTASAATPSCGLSCVNLFSRDFGTHQTPGYVVDVLKQGERVGQPVILFRTANFDPAEDWSVTFQGDVSDFYQAGLVSAALNLHYGCNWNIAEAQCSTTVNPITGLPFPDDFAFEIEYGPFGVLSGLCMGVGTTAAAGTGVALEPCGTSAKTVWVVDQADSSRGQRNPALKEYVPLINGSTVNFSDPAVLTYPRSGFPTDRPRPQLVTEPLTGFTNPGTGDPQGVDSSQLWGATLGPLK
jgi:hypothetical protein